MMTDLQIQTIVTRLDLWVCENAFWLKLGAMTLILSVLLLVAMAIDW